jgi:hypothetical protein
MIELKSGQARKVSEPEEFYNALPVMSFHASAGTYVSAVLSAKLKLTLQNTIEPFKLH